MSKKATRRAARQAFPKAKTPPPARSAYRARPKSSAGSRGRAPVRLIPKPASVKKSAIMGLVMGVAYFLLIQFAWKSNTTTTGGNLIIAAAGCLISGGVFYLTDRLKYQRYLRKKNGSSR